MNLAHLGVSTRGGVNQPLARPGVRAHRDPGALGGHRGALRYVIDAAVAGFDAYVHLEHFLGGGKEGSQRRTILHSMKNDGCTMSAVIEERGLFIDRALSHRPPHMPCGCSTPT